MRFDLLRRFVSRFWRIHEDIFLAVQQYVTSLMKEGVPKLVITFVSTAQLYQGFVRL